MGAADDGAVVEPRRRRRRCSGASYSDARPTLPSLWELLERLASVTDMAEYPTEIFATTDRGLLELMLDTQRAEIAALLDGVTDAEARASLVPSLTTLLGLVKHAAFVERVW